MALKLDISKAYDKVEWSFLRKVLFKLGFHDHFIQLVLLCVSSVSYSFILSGRQFGHIVPERGLRQGDPLSPYLFLLCTEALSSLISRAELEGHLKGICISRGAPSISHLFFADDTLLCCHASTEALNCIQNILQVYGKASGQEINYQKSVIVFSKNTPEPVMSFISEGLGIRKADRHEKYLGLPSVVGRSKRVVFESIRDKIWHKVSSWGEKQLSQAGKEVLTKAVVQAIPTYSMHVFKLPEGLVREIESMIAKFWWNSIENRKIYWMPWTQLCTSKLHGGLGLRDLRAFNSAMLAKQFWRLLVHPDSLVGQVLQARYYPGSSILDADLGSRPSFTWRSIFSSKALIQAGYRWRIGDGRTTKIWIDPWIPRLPSFCPRNAIGPLPPPTTVCHLFDLASGDWNVPLLSSIFDHDDCMAILSLPLSRAPLCDEIVWHFTRSGSFSVKSAYHVVVTAPEEFDQHTFLLCPFARIVWALSDLRWDLICKWTVNARDWLFHVYKMLDHSEFNLFLTICWSIWWSRNKRWTAHEVSTPDQTIAFARNYLSAFSGFLDPHHSLSTSTAPVKWSVPPNDVVKINSDAAIFEEAGAFGVGVIAQNSQGQSLAWTASRHHRTLSPEAAEAWAARIAIQLVVQQGWTKIIIEGDCATLHIKLTTPEDRSSLISPIIHDILVAS
ncbi:UNVERIFIED_CONTAM: putative mitochondrial protein [Sesamum latifolium]|uniref:Mitochondrial protein n=1 Tax=Sesamum latifolium TaxID=2727402 RepID=A0AAW2Y6A4_9LAMI